jgi:hypothetical protein
VNVFLNIDSLCRKYLHYFKGTLEKLEDGVAIVGSSEKVWGLETIPGEQLGANLVQ